MNQRALKLPFIIFICLMACYVFGEDVDKSKANKVKAGLIYNMIKMTSWPESSFAGNGPITILFLGEDYNDIGSYFVAQIRAHSLKVKGRRITVKGLVATALSDVVREELKRCHILFIMSTYRGSVIELLHAVGNKPVLVIGESSSFPEEGGMVALHIEKKRVAITVNLDAVKNTDLKISAQLLQHAKIVGGKQ